MFPLRLAVALRCLRELLPLRATGKTVISAQKRQAPWGSDRYLHALWLNVEGPMFVLSIALTITTLASMVSTSVSAETYTGISRTFDTSSVARKPFEECEEDNEEE